MKLIIVAGLLDAMIIILKLIIVEICVLNLLPRLCVFLLVPFGLVE